MRVLETDVLEVLLPGFTHHIDIGQDTDAKMSFGAGGLAQIVLPGKPPSAPAAAAGTHPHSTISAAGPLAPADSAARPFATASSVHVDA